MSAATRQVESAEASAAFQLALAQIGAGTVEEALDLWKTVNPADVAATSQRWLGRAISMILSRRRMSRDLAFAYYRLARALNTGTTIVDPYHPLKKNPTLGDVRREFASLIEDFAVLSGGEAPRELEPVSDDDLVLQAEEIPGLLKDEADVEAAVENEIAVDLKALGPNGLDKRLAGLDLDELTAAEVDALRADAHKASGARQSAAAERLVRDGARGTLHNIGGKDKRAIAYARASRSGTPCGWCAMLISRGAVYKSARGASFDSEGDLYHDNCNCYAEPIFTQKQYESDPRFDLNRRYQLLWPKVTKGYGGKDAVAIWRKYIREQNARPTSSPGGWVTNPTNTDRPGGEE